MNPGTSSIRMVPVRGLRLLWLLLLVATATIGAAWYFQLVLGYLPCELCFKERIPYYVGIALAALGLLSAALTGRSVPPRLFALLAGLTFLAGAGLGFYHAGVEWHFWAGPSDCTGSLSGLSGKAGDLMSAMQSTRVVACDEAHWWFLGLSFAGWNAVISAFLALLGFGAFLRLRP